MQMKMIGSISLIIMISSFFGCAEMTMQEAIKNSVFYGKSIGTADLSPDKGDVVFSVNTTKDSTIYKINTDGANLVALTKGEGFDSDPVFSPDGTKIVFSSAYRDRRGDLYLMESDGSNKVLLTKSDGRDFSPVFSSDGKKIYFLRASWFRNYSPVAAASWHDIDIYSINVDGSNLTRISHEKFYRIGHLSIHPNGTTLLAHVFEPKNPSVWTMPMSNPAERQPVCPEFDENAKRIPLFGEPKIRCEDLSTPQFSPDGKSMLFEVSPAPHEIGSLFVMDLETKKPKRVLKLHTSVRYPRFSKDGAKIVFGTSTRVGFRFYPGLWIVDADGSNARNVMDHTIKLDYVTRRPTPPPPSFGSPPASRR